MTTAATQQEQKTGAARIGNGAKLHPATKDSYGVMFRCHCPGTQSGSASHRAQFFVGLAGTCGR